MGMHVFEYTLERVAISELLDWCLSIGCPRLSFIIPAEMGRSRYIPHRSVRAILRQIIGSNTVTLIPTRAWPGTRIFPPNFPVLSAVVILTDDVVRRIVGISPNFSDWDRGRTPSLPEDFACFSEMSRLPEMFSTVHEGLLATTTRLPFAEVARQAAGEPRQLAAKYGIPPPPYFCEELEE
jgi:hypothetical protein